jgi:hypothetical protein
VALHATIDIGFGIGGAIGVGIRNSQAADTGAQIYSHSTAIPIQKPAPVLRSIDLPQRNVYRLAEGCGPDLSGGTRPIGEP